MFLVTGALFLAIMAVRITQRIAGPLFRFEQNLDNMLMGDLGDTIYLRSKDEGKDLAGKLNAFNKGISINMYTVTKESRGLARLTKQAQKVAIKLPAEQRDKIQSILWSIEEKTKKYPKQITNPPLKSEFIFRKTRYQHTVIHGFISLIQQGNEIQKPQRYTHHWGFKGEWNHVSLQQ